MEEQPVALACFIWAFPGSVALAGSGYILTHSGRLLRTARNAVKTEPCCVPFGLSASLRPKGSLSLTRMQGKTALLTLHFTLFTFRV